VRVHEFIKQAKTKSAFEIAILIEHLIMREYGFIPLEKLKNEPIPRILDLCKVIEKEKEEQSKALSRGRKPWLKRGR